MKSKTCYETHTNCNGNTCNHSSTEVCITDKTGKKFWNTVCSTQYHDSEVRNMQRHLKRAQAHPESYKFLDLASSHILVDGAKWEEPDTLAMTDDQLLAALRE